MTARLEASCASLPASQRCSAVVRGVGREDSTAALRRPLGLSNLLSLGLVLALATGCGERDAPADPAVVERVRIEGLFRNSCITCHAAGVAGAPRLGDVRWAELLAEKGMDVLVFNVRDGYNAMPPMGACPDCTEADLRRLVSYMMEYQR